MRVLTDAAEEETQEMDQATLTRAQMSRLYLTDFSYPAALVLDHY